MSQTPYGSVKSNGDKWVARIQVGGDRTQRTFESERAAWDWIRANREIASTEPTTKAPPTLLDVGKAWFDDREKAGRVRHVRQERSVWRAHVETWQDAHRPLRSLTRRHVNDFVLRERHELADRALEGSVIGAHQAPVEADRRE